MDIAITANPCLRSTGNAEIVIIGEAALAMDEQRVRRLEAVAEAARRYRAAMQRYIDDQTRLLDQGLGLEQVTEMNWGRFAATLRAEEGLYDALDALDAAVSGQGDPAHDPFEGNRAG